MSLAAGAKADMLAPEAGHWGVLLLGKAGWKEKQEGVRQRDNWRIVGCVPHEASEWEGRRLGRDGWHAGGWVVGSSLGERLPVGRRRHCPGCKPAPLS